MSFFLGLQSLVFLRNFLSVKEHGKIDLLLYFGLRGWVLFLFTRRDLTDYSLLPNGLVFMSNIYSYFVLSRVENYFVIEPKNSKKQIRPLKHGNIIFIAPNMLK